MPLYVYGCLICGNKDEIAHSIKDCNSVFYCKECGNIVHREIQPTVIQMDYPGYNCPITGKYIEGRKQHRENLEKHGCRVLETGEIEASQRRKKQMDDELCRKVEEETARIIEAMPEKKKAKLIEAAGVVS